MTIQAVEKGKKFVESPENRITINQLRKIFSAVNKIQNKVITLDKNQELSKEIANEIGYLRIKLAYQAGRFNSLKALQKLLDTEIQAIGNNKEKFEEFAILMESIVAYQKLKESNENN